MGRLLCTCIPLCFMQEMTESTTVKVSKETVRKLAALQLSLRTGSLDETISRLITDRRKKVLDSVFGSDRSKSRKFTEEDRLEDRS